IESWHYIEHAYRIFHAFLNNVSRLIHGVWLKQNVWHTHSVIKTCINEWVFNIDTSKDLHIGRVKHLIFLLMVILRVFLSMVILRVFLLMGISSVTKLKTVSVEGNYPLKPLRYLEFHNLNIVGSATAVIRNSNIPIIPRMQSVHVEIDSLKGH
ncbi:unnamed protein product, partial [Meganyctiphanes norvegica]